MSLADLDLLCAAQLPGAPNATRDEFAARFLTYFRYYAGRCCVIYKLNLSMIDDVVDTAMGMMFDPSIARFDSSRGATHLAYLRGLIQNAAKSHKRFLLVGERERQDWDDPIVDRLQLPRCVEEIMDRKVVPSFEVADQVRRVLLLANVDERLLVYRHFFEHESIDTIANSLGVTRTTVSRWLDRFYRRVAAQLAA